MLLKIHTAIVLALAVSSFTFETAVGQAPGKATPPVNDLAVLDPEDITTHITDKNPLPQNLTRVTFRTVKWQDAAKDLTQEDLVRIAALPKLRSLRVHLEQPLKTTFSLEPFRNATQLKEVWVRTEYKNANFDYNSLKSVPYLRKLRLQGAAMTDGTLKKVPPLPWLSEIELSNVHYGKMTEAAFPELQKFPRLHRITVVGIDTGAGVAKLGKKVQYLSVERCTISKTTLTAMSSLTDLRSLDISLAEGVTDDSITPLKNIPNLYSLHIKKIGPKGVMALAQCPKLNMLILRGVALKKPYIEALSKFKDLRQLALMQGTIGNAELKFLKEKCPNLTFVLDGVAMITPAMRAKNG